MRRFFFCFLICCAPLVAHAQRLDGIGVFKLGAGFDVLQSWMSENNATLEETRDRLSTAYAARSIDTKVFILLPNDEGVVASDTDANFVEGYKSVYINRYVIGDLKISDIHLLFYHNVLVQVSSDLTDSLEMALKAKYGEPKKTITRTNVITCVYKLTGATEKKSEFTTTLTWTNDKNTLAVGLDFINFDSDCHLYTIGTKVLRISSKKETSGYIEENALAGERYDKSRENAKLNAMKKSIDKL